MSVSLSQLMIDFVAQGDLIYGLGSKVIGRHIQVQLQSVRSNRQPSNRETNVTFLERFVVGNHKVLFLRVTFCADETNHERPVTFEQRKLICLPISSL